MAYRRSRYQNGNGLIGSTGQTGPVGMNGPIGSSGNAGLIGATGASGSTGTVGSVGSTGLIGNDGPIGLPGKKGITGITGQIGHTGDIGMTGLTGQIGSTRGLLNTTTFIQPSVQPHIVGSKCEYIIAELWGGGGGATFTRLSQDNTLMFTGGGGEYVKIKFETSAGDTLYIGAGEGGKSSRTHDLMAAGAGGGGSSFIYTKSYGIIAMASGGGGAGGSCDDDRTAYSGGGGGAGPRGGSGGGYNPNSSIGDLLTLYGKPAGFIQNINVWDSPYGFGGKSNNGIAIINPPFTTSNLSSSGGGGGVFGGGGGGANQSTRNNNIYLEDGGYGGGVYNTGGFTSGGEGGQKGAGVFTSFPGRGGGGVNSFGFFNDIDVIGRGGYLSSASTGNTNTDPEGDPNTVGSWVQGVGYGNINYPRLIIPIKLMPGLSDLNNTPNTNKTWDPNTSSYMSNNYGAGAISNVNDIGNIMRGNTGCVIIYEYGLL
jgi:hypothetical protein